MKYFVYVDFTNEGETFYVGKGTMSRCLQPSRNWKHEIVCEEEGFNRAIVFESENEQECFDKEIELIAEYRTCVFHYDCSDNACNFTLGGEGNSGFRCKRSDDTKLYLSLLRKGRKLSEHCKQSLSETLSGRSKPERSDQHRKNLSIALTGKKQSQETKEKRSRAMRGMKRPDVSLATKKRWAIFRYNNGKALSEIDVEILKQEGLVI